MKGTILITGGAGFVGTNLAKKFIQEGYDILAFDNLIRSGVEHNVEYLQKTFRDKYQLLRGDVSRDEQVQLLNDRPLVLILHAAANPGIPKSLEDPLYDFGVNAMGTLHVLEYARTHGKIPVIYFSTNKTYSDIINELPLTETEKRYCPSSDYLGNPETFPIDNLKKGHVHSPYGVSKLTGDLYCQEYFGSFGVPTIVNRCSCMHGLHQRGCQDQGWSSWLTWQITQGDGKINIFGTGKQVRDVLDGRDVAELCWQEFQQIDKSQGQVFNVGGGIQNTVSLFEVIETIERLSGKKAQLTFHPKRIADHDHYSSDIRKVNETLGWCPSIKPEQTIQDMISEYGGKIS